MIPSGRRKLEAPESSVVKLEHKEVKTMSKQLKLTFCMAVLAMMLMAVSSFAASTVCATFTKGTGSATPLKIAVASNFFGPAQVMVTGTAANSYTDGYFGSSYSPTNVTVQVCHNSTGTLEGEILNSAPNYNAYDILFAADSIASSFTSQLPSSIITTYDGPFLYAKGVPVFFGYLSGVTGKPNYIANVGSLITGLGSGNSYTVPQLGSDLADLNYTVNSSATSVAVANAVNAPYGTAAQNIFNQFTAQPSKTPQFDNIDLTYQSVGTTQTINSTSYNIYSGVVARSQICGDIAAGNVAYVQFTGYTLDQNAIQLTGNANAFVSYLNARMLNTTATGWDTFLTSNCYNSIS
jgi:hypothetical protein